MNWDAAGAIGELVGATAVVVSVCYLAVQIRQNSGSVRSAAFQSAVDGMNQLNNLLAQDEAQARIIRIGIPGQSELTEDERFRFGFLFLSSFRNMETMYFHYLQGTSTELWGSANSHIRILLSYPGVQEWWAENPYGFTPQFAELVEESLAEVKAAGT